MHRIPSKSSSSVPQPTPIPKVDQREIKIIPQTQETNVLPKSPVPTVATVPTTQPTTQIDTPTVENISVDDRVQQMLDQLEIETSSTKQPEPTNTAEEENIQLPVSPIAVPKIVHSPTPNIVVPKGEINDLAALKTKQQDLNAKLQALRSRMQEPNK